MAAEKEQKKSAGKDLKAMSQDEQIKLAQSAAPAHISRDATIMVVGQDGKLTKRKRAVTALPASRVSP